MGECGVPVYSSISGAGEGIAFHVSVESGFELVSGWVFVMTILDGAVSRRDAMKVWVMGCNLGKVRVCRAA